MTRYILHGGETGRKCKDNKKFFSMMTGRMKKPRILCVYFSRKKSQWPSLFENDKENFAHASPRKKPKFILANQKQFRNQVKSADVIYMRGGKNQSLKKALKPIKNLNKLFRNKIVGGSSAGANILSMYYYSTDDNKIEKGLGILPIKVFCHYFKKDSKGLEKLREYRENLKVYVVPETKPIVVR